MRNWERLGFALAIVVAVYGFLRLGSLPSDSFVPNVIVDDSLYFLMPARQLLAGHGYSFDGLHLSNGVQALWALIAILLSALPLGDELLMRVFCLASALFWVLGALLLRQALEPLRRSLGTLAATTFLFAGLAGRVAMQGMENGLHAFLSAWLVFYAVRRLRDKEAPGIQGLSAFGFGWICALFALNRTEGALLCAFMGLCVLLGGFRKPRGAVGEGGLRLCWADALYFSIPFVLLVGSWLALGAFYFSSLFPVSGEVKTFYESSWGRDTVHGPALQNLSWHFRFVRELGLAAWTSHVGLWIREGLPLSFGAWKRGLWILAGIGILAGLLRYLGRRPLLALRAVWRVPLRLFAVCSVLYCVVHLGLMGLLLPHFTAYGTWYFASEMMLFAVVFAYALTEAIALIPLLFCWQPRASKLLRGVLPVGLLLLAMLPVVTSLPLAVRPPADDPRTSRFEKAGKWLARELPEGARVGCLSAGLVAWYAKGLHVVNLDGLVNSRSYLEDVLKKGTFAEYLDRSGIRYFADYQEHGAWRHGISWCGVFPIERMRLLAWWMIDPKHSYCIWELLPEEQRQGASVLRDAGRAADRLAELRFAAATEGRFALVRDEDLASFRAGRGGEGRFVAASLFAETGAELSHVMVNATQWREIAFRRENLRPEQPLALELTPGLTLFGVDFSTTSLRAGRDFALTVYLEGGEGLLGSASCRMELRLGEGAVFPLRVAGGTRSLTDLRNGEILVSTDAVRVPESLAGTSVQLSIRCVRDGAEGPSPWQRLGELRVR